jgi:hypothetical protein
MQITIDGIVKRGGDQTHETHDQKSITQDDKMNAGGALEVSVRHPISHSPQPYVVTLRTEDKAHHIPVIRVSKGNRKERK